MITVPAQHTVHPDTKVGIQIAADKMTGDGIFANTDLIRVRKRGWGIVNVVGDNVAHELYVPQCKHRDEIPNYTPVLRSGIAPDEHNMVNYKVPLCAGDSLICKIDLNTGSAAYALGMFAEGEDNIMAHNTPDIVVSKPVVASAQNVLEGTDLEDIPYSGWMYVWFSSNQSDTQIAINQRNHKPGNYSMVPNDGAGTSCQCNLESAHKVWIGKQDIPQITVTEVTAMAAFLVVAFFIRDSRYKPFSQ